MIAEAEPEAVEAAEADEGLFRKSEKFRWMNSTAGIFKEESFFDTEFYMYA